MRTNKQYIVSSFLLSLLTSYCLYLILPRFSHSHLSIIGLIAAIIFAYYLWPKSARLDTKNWFIVPLAMVLLYVCMWLIDPRMFGERIAGILYFAWPFIPFVVLAYLGLMLWNFFACRKFGRNSE